MQASGKAGGNGVIRVLHVDDDVSMLEVSKLMLLDLDSCFEIDQACCVDEAFKKLLTGQYDIVISDYEMPQKDGLQFLSELREQNNNIPFILFTGKGREEIAIKAITLGVNGYHNKQGNPQTVYGELVHIVKEVVEHKKADLALVKLQLSTHSIIDSTNDMIWSVNATDFGLTDFNQSLQTYFLKERGITIKIGDRPEELFPTSPESVEKWRTFYTQALKENSFTTQYKVYSGKRILELTFNTIKRGDETFGISVFGKDITEQTHSEAARRASQRELEESQRIASLGTWTLDIPAGVFETSDLMDEIFGINKTHDHSVKGWAAMIHPDDRPMMVNYLQNEVIARRQPCDKEFRIIRVNDKATRWLHALGRIEYDAKGHPTKVRGTSQDITERKLAQKTLLESEQKFEMLTEKSLLGCYIIQNDKFVYVNSSFAKIYGYSVEEVIGRLGPKDIVHPDDIEVVKRRLQQRLSGKTESDWIRYKSTKKDGSSFYTSVFSNNVIYQGKPAVMGVLQDVTERKKAEDAAIESEEKFRKAFAAVPDAIHLGTLAEGKILEVNEPFLEVFGYSRQELIGQTSLELNLWANPEDRKKLVHQLITEGKVTNFETIGRRKNGQLFSGLLSFSLVQSTNPQLVIAVVKDISNIKQAEEAIRKNEQNLKLTFDAVNDGFWDWDMISGKAIASPRYFTMVGYEQNEFSLDFNTMTSTIVHPEDAKLLRKTVEECTKNNKPFAIEIRLKTKAGGWCWVLSRGKIVEWDNQGKPFRMIGTHTDITERKNMENSIADSQKKFQNLVETTGEFIWEMDPQGRYTYCSPQMEKLWGLKPKEMIGKTPFEMMPPDERKKASEFFGAMNSSPKPFNELQTTSYDSQGRLIYIETNGVPFFDDQGKLLGFRGISRDITEHKKVEEKLKQSDLIFENSLDMLCVAGFDGYFKVLNPAWSKTLGWSKEELLSKPWIEFVHPEDKEVTSNIKATIVDGKEVFQFSNRYICKDSSIKWLSWNSFPYPAEKIMFGVARDVTDSRQAEERLALSEQKYRELADSLPEIIFEANEKGIPTFVNKEASKILGYSSDEITNMHILQFIVPEDHQRAKEEIYQRIQGIESPGHEYTIIKKDGNFFPAIIFTQRVKLIDKKYGLRGFIVDISEIRRTSKELSTLNEKLRVVGSLTRHDVGNKLMIARANLHLLKKHLTQTPDLIKYVEGIESSLQASERIFEFNRFYEKIGVEKQEKTNVGENFNLATAQISNTHKIKVINQCNDLEVIADKLLKQLFFNFLDNSIKHGEKVTQIKLHYTQDDQEIKIIYEDDGVGIPKINKPKLFNAGFTTHRESSGLGLYLVKKMMDVYGWTIQEIGEPGKGVKFKITIPKHAHIEPKGAEQV